MRKTSKFFPSLEGLSDRTVPAVTSAFQNGVLTITPTDASDTSGGQVLIAMAGDQVLVFDNGTLDVVENAQSLWKIDATTGAGDDNVVAYFGDSFKSGQSVTLNVDTGDGNDRVQVHASGIGTGGYLNTTINTGAGDDQVRENLGTIHRGGIIDTNVDLGAGNDLFKWVGSDVRPGSHVNMMVNAGPGADTIDVAAGSLRKNVNFYAGIDLGSDSDVDTVNLSSFGIAKSTFTNINITGATTTGDTGVDVINQQFLSPVASVMVNGVASTFQDTDTGDTINILNGITTSTTETDNSTTGTDTSGSCTDTSGTGTDTSGSGTDNTGSGTDTSTSGTDTSGSGTDTSGSGGVTPGA